MNSQKIVYPVLAVFALALIGYLLVNTLSSERITAMDSTPQEAVLSGTYECLPHLDTSGPQTMECAFGLRTDDGDHYAVNFGASAGSMEQFQSGAHITAEGFIIVKEALSSDHWAKYDMKGIFTITAVHEEQSAPPQGKLNINAVCQGALAYMTFTDGASAEAFVADCIEGKHPEVIEQYKAQMGLGDGAEV